MAYYRIVDNGVGNYTQDQVVDGELLGEVDRLLELGAIAPVDDADVPADAVMVETEEAVAETEEAPAMDQGVPMEEPAPAAEPATPTNPFP